MPFLKASDFIHQNSTAKLIKKINLTGYAAISALMEQKARLYEVHKDPVRTEQAKRFPIKLIRSDKNNILSNEPKKLDDNQSVASMINGTKFLDLTKPSNNHTLNIGQYLKYRLPKIISELANDLEVMVWVDTNEKLDLYLKNHGIYCLGQIHAQNMRKFLLTKKPDGSYLFLIAGFPCLSNLQHLLLQLLYSNVDIHKVNIVGDLNNNKLNAFNELVDRIKKIMDPAADDKILFIGSRSSTMNSLTPLSSKVTPHKIASSFEFNDLDIKFANNKKIQVFILKIPQGESAYDATKAFLMCGIKKIVMTGAGGAIKAKVNVGDYVFVNESEYEGNIIRLDDNSLVKIDDCSYATKSWASNVTVDSPLDETAKWSDNNKNYGCVDVETYHIFKALSEEINLKIISGLFISDIINHQPFFDLLSGSPVGKNIGDFSLKALNLMSSMITHSLSNASNKIRNQV